METVRRHRRRSATATVVVVDDDANVRRVVCTLLGSEGYKALPFRDAGMALEQVDFSRVDLVVTDLHMAIPGDELVRQLRAQGCEVPVVVVSGYVAEDRARDLESLGVRDIVLKPFDAPATVGQ